MADTDTDNRNFNGFEFGFQLERTQAGPIDATQLVYGSANLISEDTWKNNSGVYTFPGMLVSTVDNITDKNYTGTYVLTKSEYQTEENWDKLVTESDIKALNTQVVKNTDDIAGINTILEGVAKQKDLNTAVSRISANETNIGKLSSRVTTIEGSYATKSYTDSKADNALKDAKAYVDGITPTLSTKGELTALNTKVGKNTTAIAGINTTLEGVAKQSDLDSALSSISDNETNIGKNTDAIAAINDSENGILAQAKAYADSLDHVSATEFDSLQKTVADHTTNIGDINTGLSELSGKVTTIESTYANKTQVGTDITNAITTAARDATSKANKALEDANSYTDNKIAELSIADYAKTTDVKSDINSAKLELQDKIDKKVATSVYEDKVLELEDDIAEAKTAAGTAEANAKAYTDLEVKKVSNELEAVKSFSVQVVNELPDQSEAEERVIYLVPTNDDSDDKAEYLWIDGAWELIGTTAINLEEFGPIKQDIETNKSNIAKNTSDITTNKSNISKNASDIATNKSNISALMEAFPTENPNIIDPKSSISLAPSTTSYEVGTTANITLTSVFTPAKYSPKYEAGKFNTKTDGTFKFCGDATSCQLTISKLAPGSSSEDTNYSVSASSTNVFSTTINKTFEFAKYSIFSEISYKILTDAVYNNKGETTGVDQPSSLSGSIDSAETTLYGTLPIYGTTSTIDKLTKQSTQIKSNQSTVEITLAAQTSKDKLQMILVPQDWCGDDGPSSIGQYNKIFNTYDVITNNFKQVYNVRWMLDSSNKFGFKIPENGYITDNYLYSDNGPIDTSRNYVLLINTSGNVGKRKIQITK